MKTVALVLVLMTTLGYSYLTLAQSDNPLGLTSFQWLELQRVSEINRQARESIQRQIEAQMELKRRGQKLNTLYSEMAELFNTLNGEQVIQYQQQVKGIVDIKQNVIVSKLTGELRDKVEILWKMNKE
ncbi:MAG TPA: hypothetical protein VJN02_00060 [Gammaproteobacteria bacterium]|nr:hypothetical protein [Gammaproteobacteria bacterium]